MSGSDAAPAGSLEGPATPRRAASGAGRPSDGVPRRNHRSPSGASPTTDSGPSGMHLGWWNAQRPTRFAISSPPPCDRSTAWCGGDAQNTSAAVPIASARAYAPAIRTARSYAPSLSHPNRRHPLARTSPPARTPRRAPPSSCTAGPASTSSRPRAPPSSARTSRGDADANAGGLK